MAIANSRIVAQIRAIAVITAISRSVRFIGSFLGLDSVAGDTRGEEEAIATHNVESIAQAGAIQTGVNSAWGNSVNGEPLSSTSSDNSSVSML